MRKTESYMGVVSESKKIVSVVADVLHSLRV